ncbi:MAG TPA: ABC transporter ATP-binding protein [Beijerinckiaceae bacterium]|nr:ABC transporter ATP-binding protein [Beijerinckiaceae bacterium]
MLEVTGLVSAYGRVEVLHGVAITVDKGEIVTLVGANGAGKTTLLRCISGVQPMRAGTIRFDGQPIERMPAHRRVGLGLAQVPEGRHVFGPVSVEDNLRLGAYTRSDRDIDADLEKIYDLFPILKEKRLLHAAGLSGGQQQMLAMGRAMMSRPRLLLLDEPSMGLAPVIVEQIFGVIRKLAAEGVTILLVEQNAFAALSMADRGYVVETGRIAFTGSGKDLLVDPRVREAYLGL